MANPGIREAMDDLDRKHAAAKSTAEAAIADPHNDDKLIRARLAAVMELDALDNIKRVIQPAAADKVNGG